MTAETSEQQPAWTQPGAHFVAPGVHRIPLQLPLTGLAAVNAYLLEAPDGLILIDPGWAGKDNEEAIVAALHRLGHKLSDLTTCLATHHHWDHYTQAYAWRDSLNTRLLVGREEHHSIEAYRVHTVMFPEHPQLLRRCGAPELAAQLQTEEPPEHEKNVPYGPPDAWLEDGERLSLRQGALEVVATPGHTRGHVAYRHSEAGLLFSGDHVLPTITPSLGFEMAPAPHPLSSFLSSLRLLLDQPDTTLLPAHGPVTVSTHSRVREILEHHEQRLDEVQEILTTGATTTYDVAAQLPWTRRRNRLHDLPLAHQMSAVMEIEAHLEVLSMLGRITWTNTSTARQYSARSRSHGI